ncbi:MAG TPA: Uma2 family endonuclease [Tepidisphaeraceae bacterium]|nr:Uma2 family endonuclease [Tepidisphaeraceae bacterium]
MTVAEHDIVASRDPYRFGDGPEPVLKVGTLGWSLSDLKDPEVRRLWEQGRYEIVNGVLVAMPPAYFRGGRVVVRLQAVLNAYFDTQQTPNDAAVEVEIAVAPKRVVRADCAVVAGQDLARFQSLKFDPPDTDWSDHTLTLPPTIVIESVSKGHEDHDRVTKRAWYAEFGIPHYWVVDGVGRTLECLRLAGAAYVVDAVGHGDDVISPTAFPDLQIDLKRLWNSRSLK